MKTLDEIRAEAMGTNVVCVDFDGVIHNNTHWKLGDPKILGSIIQKGARLCRALDTAGYRVVVLTARTEFGFVRAWLRDNKVPFEEVTNVKPPAIAYIDDRAISFDVGMDMSSILRRVQILREK